MIAAFVLGTALSVCADCPPKPLILNHRPFSENVPAGRLLLDAAPRRATRSGLSLLRHRDSWSCFAGPGLVRRSLWSLWADRPHDASAVFFPRTLLPGIYEVWVSYLAHPGGSPQVTAVVYHNGTRSKVRFSQQAPTARAHYRLLGRFRFGRQYTLRGPFFQWVEIRNAPLWQENVDAVFLRRRSR